MKNIIAAHKKTVVAAAALALAGTLLVAGTRSRSAYTAHEWGTFTSVQGADGVLLDWRPLQSAKLPGFVYDWSKPGLNRQSLGAMTFAKAAYLTLQRMETPVIYFYSSEEQSVDVTVDFPKGTITEWYPQAAQIGPSVTPTPAALAKLNEYAHKLGAKPSFDLAAWFGDKNVKESKIRWANVRLLPRKMNPEVQNLLPSDRSGSHYFAARETEADFVRLASLVATNPAPEQEQFLFYRGVGSFPTPLTVTMKSDQQLELANTGQEGLGDLFLLEVKNGSGYFKQIPGLAAGGKKSIGRAAETSVRLPELQAQVGEAVAHALVQAGLYPKEASAMVATWRDSWFTEDGVRVLYILPREWTDRTLPIKLDPAPRELVRVMVGRAEVLTPAMQQGLSDLLTQVEQGDSGARTQLVEELRKLGRFSEPALRLAIKNAGKERAQIAWGLFAEAAKPAAKPL